MKTLYTIQNTQERIDWIRLARTSHIGSATFWALMDSCGTPMKAIEFIRKASSKYNKNYVVPSVNEIQAELNKCLNYGAKIILACDRDYPKMLFHTKEAPPPCITVRGKIDLLNKPILAIIGSRNATINGLKLAKHFAHYLSSNGYVIISGLAKGIDAAAHKGAIDNGTIGVIAGGIDHIYPRENADLFERMAVDGVIISEFSFGAKPIAQSFPQRNRIIAALSRAVIIVEAARASGTLITARCALEYGRELFALPGSPLDPNAQGTNYLIRQGARLVMSPEQILEDLNSVLSDSFAQLNENFGNFSQHDKFPAQFTEENISIYRETIYNALSHSPCHFDLLVEYAKVPSRIAAIIVIELELEGKICRTQDNKLFLL